MPTPKMTIDKVLAVMGRYEEMKELGLSNREIAREMGLPRSTLQQYVNQHSKDFEIKPRQPAAELDIPTPPDGAEPIAELIARKKLAYARESASDEFHKLIPIKVKTPGPVAICAVGDPHVDDDRADIGAIERDMTIIGQSEGMFALHLGDCTNQWPGRLARLYAHQTTKASDGIRLTEWMFNLAPPLAVVGGNHDIFLEGMNWLNFVIKQAGTQVSREHGVRLELKFPKGDSVRLHARHDFPGHSQFNPLHGLRKEHLHGLRDHINIAGHKHIDSYAVVPSPDGYMQHMLRVSGYKRHDDYAQSLNLKEMKMAPTVAIVIDPMAKVQAELIKPFWCLEEAADFLTFKRKRAGV
jgi:transcriptional regulator with XRE-family HTH domain